MQVVFGEVDLEVGDVPSMADAVEEAKRNEAVQSSVVPGPEDTASVRPAAGGDQEEDEESAPTGVTGARPTRRRTPRRPRPTKLKRTTANPTIKTNPERRTRSAAARRRLQPSRPASPRPGPLRTPRSSAGRSSLCRDPSASGRVRVAWASDAPSLRELGRAPSKRRGDSTSHGTSAHLRERGNRRCPLVPASGSPALLRFRRPVRRAVRLANVFGGPRDPMPRHGIGTDVPRGSGTPHTALWWP